MSKMIINPDKLKYLDYSPEYGEDLVDMWRESKQKALQINHVHNAESDLNFLNTHLTENYQVKICIDGGSKKILGFIAYSKNEISQLYIHVDAQKLGIGMHFVNLAKEYSAGILRLYTFQKNQGAIKFYKNQGFHIIAEEYENEENLPDYLLEWQK